MEWISVNEKLPPHLTNVLLDWELYFQQFTTRGFYDGKNWYVMTWEGKKIVPFQEVKHWMPLPTKP